MSKLKIGVFITDFIDPKTGGGSGYQVQLIDIIDQYSFDSKIEVVFITYEPIERRSFEKDIVLIPIESHKKAIQKSKRFRYKKLKQIPIFGNRLFKAIVRKEPKLSTNDFISISLKEEGIELLYFLKPQHVGVNYPFVATHWDLGHKNMYAFPEVAMNGTYESREKYHRENLAKAFAIFTESETSKKELIHFEGINADRIFVLPLIPSQVIDLKIDEKSQLNMLLKWNLKKNGFIYYPAQFWSHKNHYNLLQALKILLDEGYSLKLVFSGSDKGNLTYVKEVVDRLEINDSVVFAGFVSEEEVFSLYKNALCMCMPTLLGPTNMPLLEAYYLDCPVVCSNLDGHREQMQERAIYFDPCNPKDIAESIKKVQLDQVRTQDKRELFDINSIGKKLNNHFLEIAPIRKSFGFDFDQF